MNELIFLCHIWVMIGFAFLALRGGQIALVAFIALQGVLANLFVVKQMSLFGFSVTCSDVFIIGAILSQNLLQEYFGKEVAKKATYISLLALLFFAVMSQIHLAYRPLESDCTHSSFLTILSPSLRITLASLATFFIVQQFDIRFFSILKGALPIRIAISLTCSQLLDTVLFSFLGLFGIVHSIFDIILVSFIIKCLIIFATFPLTTFSKRFVKHEV